MIYSVKAGASAVHWEVAAGVQMIHDFASY